MRTGFFLCAEQQRENSAKNPDLPADFLQRAEGRAHNSRSSGQPEWGHDGRLFKGFWREKEEKNAGKSLPGCNLLARVNRLMFGYRWPESWIMDTLRPETAADAGIRLAERVFGDPEKPWCWLRKACRGLDGAVPLDLLETEAGAQIVERTLHQIDHGIYA
jgi:hypothetical protein